MVIESTVSPGTIDKFVRPVIEENGFTITDTYSLGIQRKVLDVSEVRSIFELLCNSRDKKEVDIGDMERQLLMPYEVFRKNFFAHMNELEITPGKVRLDEAIRLIVCRMSDFLVPYVISIN